VRFPRTRTRSPAVPGSVRAMRSREGERERVRESPRQVVSAFTGSGSAGRLPSRRPLGAVLGELHHTALPLGSLMRPTPGHGWWALGAGRP
jgi:hypothetical protein